MKSGFQLPTRKKKLTKLMEVGENREMEKGQKRKTPWKRNHV